MVYANFTVEPSSGYVYATDIKITDTTTTSSKIVNRTWDLGDGTFIYDTSNVVKNYDYPGSYTISLTATDLLGNVSTKTATVSVDYFLRDVVEFAKLPGNYADPGKFTLEPFQIKVKSAQINTPITVNLFAAISPSTPQQFVPKHWKFLTPTWYFTDKNYNFITSLSVATTPIYHENRVAAVSGTAEFYYVDDMSTGDPIINCPVVITATLETSGFSYFKDSIVYPYSSYSNNKNTVAATVWRVNSLRPNILKITENYITDIFPKKWKDVKVPFLITAHRRVNDVDSNILFSYPETNFYGSISSVIVSLSNTSGFIVDEAPLYFQAKDNNHQTGGYIYTTLTPTSAVNTTVIQASTVAHFTPQSQTDINTFLFPDDAGANTSVWISNPERGTISRVFIDVYPDNCEIINYYKNNQLLYDGLISTYEVPRVESTSTYNYAMSGFSGIYSIAVDSKDNSVIAADAELDCLYRISTTGTILSTYCLSSLGDYFPTQKLFYTWSWVTAPQEKQATYFTFYSPALFSTNPKNYILLAGGAHQPNGIISIDPVRKAMQLKIAPDIPPTNINIDLIEIFNSQLPAAHASSITSWTLAATPASTTYLLTGNPSLSADPNYYIVSLDGAVLMSDNYSINNSTKSIILCSAPPANTTLSVTYLPTIRPPANWILLSATNVYNTNKFFYERTGHPNYINDPTSHFLVNIGGVLQSPNTYTIDRPGKFIYLNLDSPVDSSVPISITQISVSGDALLEPAYTPSYLSIDKNKNFWVSVFNTATVLKFDSNFNLIGTAVPNETIIQWPERQFTVAPSQNYLASLFGDTDTPLTSADYFVDEFFLKPPVVETDKENNIWVSYAHPLCSMLVKYNEQGQQLYHVPLPYNSVPVGLAITKENNVWVSNSYNTTVSGGSLQLYSTTGTLMSTVTGMTRPGYIAIDRKNDVWFTHGIRNIGYLTTSGNLSSWLLSADNNTFVSVPVSAYPLYEDEELGGLAVDVYNRVWVIDALNNKTFTFLASSNIPKAKVRGAKILPDSLIGYHIDLDTGETLVKSGIRYKSAQATGDWTCNRWYQKYIETSLTAVPLTGISTEFSVNELINPAQIYLKNENFNTASYIKSLALPEILYQNTEFFDTFLGAVVGNNVLSANEDVGQKVYERIANFVGNFSDIDTCNSNQLLSFALKTATPFKNYNLNFPAEIQKYIDITSIPRQKLWGMKSPVPLSSESIGQELNTNTAYVTAGTKIYLKNKFTNEYTLYPVPLLSAQSITPLSAQSVYPLSAMNGVGLIQPFLLSYQFYEYSPVYSNIFIENIIDWTNPNTTLQPHLSTTTDWAGELGAIENTFNYLLTKNLLVK